MGMKFTNNASTTLASGILVGATSLSVQTGAGSLFPVLGAGDYFYCTLSNTSGSIEIIKVTARTGDTFSTIVRAQDGTSALGWNAGDRVELRLVSASLNDFPKLDENNVFTGTNTENLSSASTAVTQTAGDSSTKIATTSFVQTAVSSSTKNPYRLTHLLHPNNAYSVFKAGWRPAMFAQNTGIAANVPFILTDGATGVTSEFWAATGNVKDDTAVLLGNAAANTYKASGFKLSVAETPPGVWVKAYKVGNPADNLTWSVRADSAGSPTGANLFTALTLSGKQITSDPAGAWYFISGTTAALAANTQYHDVFSRSGAVDASNYYVIKATAANTYPHGFLNTGDATPTWTQTTTAALCCIHPSTAANALVQSGGQFGNSKLVFAEGTPLDQSRGLIAKLTDLDFTPDEFTIRLNGAAFTKDKTILDLLYGLDHDRAVLRCNVTTGFLQFDVYDSTGTKRTVTGTTDVSTGTNHDVVLHVRAKGDGADKVEMLVDGVAATPVTAATFTFARELQLLGHCWLGGGFNLAPTWTQKLDMSVLPSAATPAWTWTGTGTEANCMSVANGRLLQNKNGYGSTQTGYYAKATLALSNANGWDVPVKSRTSSNTNTPASTSFVLQIEDGTKILQLIVQEYFIQAISGANTVTLQTDTKTSEVTLAAKGKGSDFYVTANGRVIIDGAGLLVGASANNAISFGDLSATAGENADVVYDYVAYYNTAAILPQFTSGEIHEFAIFSGDMTSIAASLWNNGSPISVKQFCGVGKDWVKEVSWVETRRGVTSGPTTTSTTPATLAEMECFVVGEVTDISASSVMWNSATNLTYLVPRINGTVRYDSTGETYGAAEDGQAVSINNKGSLGLYRVDACLYVSAGTGYGGATKRQMKVEAK